MDDLTTRLETLSTKYHAAPSPDLAESILTTFKNRMRQMGARESVIKDLGLDTVPSIVAVHRVGA